MRGAILSGIGAMLILATHSVAPLLSPMNVQVLSGLDEPNEHPTFALIMPRLTWWGLTLQDRPDIQALSERAREALEPVVNQAVERAGLDCRDQWALTSTFELTDSKQVGVSGICRKPVHRT